jgi:hypothetical protein
MPPLVNPILTEEDDYVGIDIRQQLPNDGDYVKMKLKPEDEGIAKDFLYGKVSKIFKGDVGEVIVDEDEYILSFELTIHQYFMDDGRVIYDKYKYKQTIILGTIINWRLITDEDYRIVNDAFEKMRAIPQPEPVLEQNPITDVPIQGGRRKSRRNRRKSRRNIRKTRRSRR